MIWMVISVGLIDISYTPKVYNGIFFDTGFQNHCHRLHFDICYHVVQPLSWTSVAISGSKLYVCSVHFGEQCMWLTCIMSIRTNRVLFNSTVLRVVQCVCVCVQHSLLCWCLLKLTLSLQFNIIIRTMQVRLSFLFLSHQKALASSPLLPSLINP